MIKDELDAIIKKSDIDAGILICYGNQTIFEYQAEKIFPSAGLVGLGIAAFIENEWKKDAAILDEKLLVADLSRVHGDGVISRLRQHSWSMYDLIYLMLALGDNAASNLLIERFDIYDIDDWLQENYPGMRLGREMMRYSAIGQDNEITATAACQILKHFMNDESKFGKLVHSALKTNTMSFHLATYDDASFPIYTKASLLPHLQHEITAFKTEKGPFEIVVLTQYSDKKSQDNLFIQEVGKTIFSKITVPKNN